MAVYNYDPSQVIVMIGGNLMQGFADGDFISIEREEQSFTKVVGADGFVSRAKTSNRSGTMTLTLKQTSPSNEILSDFLAQDEANANGIFQVLIKEGTGGSRLFTATGWVQGMPTISYGKEINDREWLIDLAEIEFDIKGNDFVTSGE